MTIYNKKEELLVKWRHLRDLAFATEDFNTCMKIRQKEEEYYKQYLFYKNYINAERKINKCKQK